MPDDSLPRPVFLAITDEDGILIDRFELRPEELALACSLMERLFTGYQQAQKRHGQVEEEVRACG